MNEENMLESAVNTVAATTQAINTMSNNNGVWYFNWYKRLPKVLRIIVQVILILSIVYYGTILLYKIWDGLGKILHWLTERRNWWVYSTSVLILIVGSLIVMQIYAPYKPFTELIKWFKSLWDFLIWWN